MVVEVGKKRARRKPATKAAKAPRERPRQGCTEDTPEAKAANKRGGQNAFTKQRELFVQEYLVDLNARAAAIRAGYSENGAAVSAWRLMQRKDVQDGIAKAMAERVSRIQVTQDRVVDELAKIGFADIRNAVRWGNGMAVVDPETGEAVITNGVSLVASDEIDPDTAAAISEVGQGQGGTLKIKMHDKRAALIDLGKHLGMFKEKVEHSGDVGLTVNVMRFSDKPSEG